MLAIFASQAFALSCTIRASTQYAAVTEAVEFSGTAVATNSTYPVESVEISKNDGQSWSGVVGKETWRDLWVAHREGLFVIRARATDANGTVACLPETIDVYAKTINPFPRATPFDFVEPTPVANETANASNAEEATPTPAITATPKPSATAKPTVSKTPVPKNNSTEEPLPTPPPRPKKGAEQGFFEFISSVLKPLFEFIGVIAGKTAK